MSKILVWADDVNSAFAAKMLKFAMKGGRELYFNSRGGDTDCMCSVLDLMAAGGWTVVASGSIMSAAVPILASGDKGLRLCTPRTRFLLHLPRLWSMGAATSDELETESGELRLLEELYCGVLGDRTRKPSSFWLDKIRQKRDWYFGAQEALKYGLIDEIIKPE